MNRKILISTALLAGSMLVAGSVNRTHFFGEPIKGLGANYENLTAYEIQGLDSLYEIADLANHVPESYTISRRTSNDVRERIVGFSLRGADRVAAGGFVSVFLDLIERDQEVAYLLKNIDLRLNMLRKSSANYTSVLSQYLAVTDPTYECLFRYEQAMLTVATGVHNLYAYTYAKVNGADTNTVYEKLEAFRQVCNNNMCMNATNVLFSGLNGGSFADMKCDLINTLYQGLPGAKLDFTYKYEKGYRDMVTPYMGYLMSFASTSLVVQSAYESL